MAVVERAERDVVPELGVPLLSGETVSYCASSVEGKILRSHVRRSDRIGWRRREVNQRRRRHLALVNVGCSRCCLLQVSYF
jgi:hypothetical protein